MELIYPEMAYTLVILSMGRLGHLPLWGDHSLEKLIFLLYY